MVIRFLGWDTAFSCIHALLVGAKLLVYISSLVGRQTIKGGLHGIPFMLVSAKASQRYIPTHRKWSEAERLGATHVHARVEQGVLARQNLEAELIQAYQPRLNVQLR